MILVRAYRPDDAEQVGQIMQECTSELRTVYVLNPQVSAAASRSLPVLNRVVALSDTGAIVGVAEFEARQFALYAQSVAVAPVHRQRGTAGALLNYIAAAAVDLGIGIVEIATIKETGNVAVFARLGFSMVAECPSERFLGSDGQVVTEVTLRRHVI